MLIKSTMSILPTYYLSIFEAPSKVTKAIKKLQRDFLWEPGEQRKDHFLKREVVCKSQESGGLGIGHLVKRNDPLLAQWLWSSHVNHDDCGML